ncbi:MAG TPA: glycosyltransferase family 2 protein [Thermoanaerobaculia bacterium]|jgi:GT2 family glycosyltransferase|nr:glycosyltransferase family 2 protein [Thermoanaerobaculia bacterium]
MNDVSVIVLDIDGGDMLRACLDSIAAQTLPPREVIVFDNGSRTPVAERIAFRHGLHSFRSETNLGFAGGNNAAYRHASGEYIALVNNDVILDRDWLATVVTALDADPKLAAVQTILRRDEKTIDGAGIDISDGTFRQITSECVLAWGVSATAALYRREALGHAIFDETLFAYYEDVDLCGRLYEAGWRTEVLPVIKATHRGSQSASILGAEALRLRTRNRYLVARKHRGVGRIRALILEDLKLALRGRTSLRGMWQGLFTR